MTSANVQITARAQHGDDLNQAVMISDSNDSTHIGSVNFITGAAMPDSGLFAQERQFLRKLVEIGYRPTIVFDVGASTGIWSEMIATVLPGARFELFEPLAGYPKYSTGLEDRLRRMGCLHLNEVALGEENGEQLMCVADGLYGSSLRDRGSIPETLERIPVSVCRLDDIVTENRLPWPDIVKIDCQGAEDAIIRGGIQTLSHADVLFLETWLVRGYGPKTPLLTEIIEMLRPLSFTILEIGEKFFDESHRLYSVDAFFGSERLLSQVRLPAG